MAAARRPGCSDRPRARHAVFLTAVAHIAPALAATRRVFVFDHLGYGQSDMREGETLTIAAQARRLADLLRHWDLGPVSVAANDIGGAITLRAMLLEEAQFSDLTLFDCVSGGQWEVGLFAQIREHPDLFAQLPGYAHRALVTSHLRNATYAGYRPGVLEAFLQPWLGADGQAAFTGNTVNSPKPTPTTTPICSPSTFPCACSGDAREPSCPHPSASGSPTTSDIRACAGSTTPGTSCKKTHPRS